jgi:glutamate N-acetyltransferase/amino-acid N-acetyltransferase
MQNAQTCCKSIAQELGLSANQILPFSTGIIGEQLPMPAMQKGIEKLLGQLAQQDSLESNWLAAAHAIMTTDTLAKGVSEQVEVEGHTITVTGIAKGAGMMEPNMATLLSYVATDAAMDASILDIILARTADASFNRITVDSDTSTNDSLILIATGTSDLPTITSIERAEAIYAVIEKVMIGLATSVVRDAEGATKFVKVEVINGANPAQSERIAYDVANSPLVKIALFASDPNWGRLVMAIGKNGREAEAAPLEISKLNLSINDLQLLEKGEPSAAYTEEAGQTEFSKEEINIRIDLGNGDSNYHVWTSDLSHDYVSINADYRS